MSWEQQYHDPALIAQRPQPTEAEIAPTAIEWMFVCFAHNHAFFADAQGLIQEIHFLPAEEPLKYLWRALCKVIPEYGGVTYANLRLTYEQFLREDPNVMLSPSALDIIFRPDDSGLLWSVANPPPDITAAANIETARALLRKFSYERSIVAPTRRMVQPGFAGGIPANLGEFFKAIEHQHNRIMTVDRLPIANVAPDMTQPLQQAFEFKQTGVSFVDEPLGGQRVGDVCGLLGPTGGGKTTLAGHMAIASARQCWSDAMRGGPREATVFITVEEEAKKLLPRLWSTAFQIPRDKLERMTDFSALTTRETLQEYERRLAQAGNVNNGEILSETERFACGMVWLKEHFILLDLSGSDANPNAGYGYIDEISSYLARIQQQLQIGYRSVYLDYAGLSVERHMQAEGLMNNDKVYRNLLKSFGDEFRRKVSERYKTTSWILHQLKGDVGKAKPTVLMHHTDAGESKDFAVNMAVCGCLGTADPQTGCRRLNWSKVRFRANEQIAPATLRIHDQFAMMEDVSSLYLADEHSRQFISREDAREIGGLANAQRHQPALAGAAGTHNRSPIAAGEPAVVDPTFPGESSNG